MDIHLFLDERIEEERETALAAVMAVKPPPTGHQFAHGSPHRALAGGELPEVAVRAGHILNDVLTREWIASQHQPLSAHEAALYGREGKSVCAACGEGGLFGMSEGGEAVSYGWPCLYLRALALPYQWHEDYDADRWWMDVEHLSVPQPRPI